MGKLALLCRAAQAGNDGFFQLADALTGDTQHFTDLFQGFFAVKQAKTAGDDFTFPFAVDGSQDIANKLFGL